MISYRIVSILLVTSITLLIAASYLYATNLDNQRSAEATSTSLSKQQGFLIKPVDQFDDSGNFLGPQHSDFIPHINQIVEGTVSKLILSADKFAAYSDDYNSSTFLNLSLFSKQGDEFLYTVEGAQNMYVRKCNASDNCPSFDLIDDTESFETTQDFDIVFVGEIEEGDSIKVIRSTHLGNLNDATSIYSSDLLFVTRIDGSK